MVTCRVEEYLVLLPLFHQLCRSLSPTLDERLGLHSCSLNCCPMLMLPLDPLTLRKAQANVTQSFPALSMTLGLLADEGGKSINWKKTITCGSSDVKCSGGSLKTSCSSQRQYVLLQDVNAKVLWTKVEKSKTSSHYERGLDEKCMLWDALRGYKDVHSMP